MLVLNLHNLLNDKGIEQHNLFLQKIGIHRSTASNILNSNFTFINILHISKICHALNCLPSDLFVWVDSPSHPLTETHALQKLKKKNTPPLTTRIRNLNPDQLDQLSTILEGIEKQNSSDPQ